MFWFAVATLPRRHPKKRGMPMNRLVCLLALLTLANLHGCGRKPLDEQVAPTVKKTAPASFQADSNIPGDSFRLTVEDGGSSESHITKKVVVELPADAAGGKRLVLGLGKQSDYFTPAGSPFGQGGPREKRGVGIRKQGILTFDVVVREINPDKARLIPNNMRGIDVVLECVPDTWPDAGFKAGPMTYFLKDGKLSDIFSFTARAGLYKMATPVSVATLLGKDKVGLQPITLHLVEE
jgi:hypothetical protein